MSGRQVSSSPKAPTACWAVLLLLLVSHANLSTAFTTIASPWTRINAQRTAISMAAAKDDDITRLQLKARRLLEKSRAKLASKAEPSTQKSSSRSMDTDESLPFFASSARNRDGVIKSRNAETGLVTADGERMAALSEQEEWENRSLLEVFENEIDENEDVYSLASQQLASRDVAASIMDLRKQLQTDDYKRIFNKRNPFIGEDN